MKRSETVKKTPQSSRRKGFTTDVYKRMVALYENGRSASEVAREFGCSGGRVLQVLHEHGVEVRACSTKFSDEDRQEMVVLYGQGKSCYEIAKIYSCSSVAVRSILRGLGVKMRRTSVPGEYSDDVRREVVRMYQEGQPQFQIVSRFGFAGKTVKKILDESGVVRRSSTQFQARYTDEDHRRMVAMYEQGEKLQAIAEEFSCSRFALDRIFTKLGVKKRPSSPYRRFSQEDFQQILEMFESGKKYSEIAKEFDAYPKTIGNIVRRFRSPLPHQSPSFSEHDHHRIVDLYEIGLSTSAIAEEFQCGKKEVREALEEKRIELRPNRVRDTFSAKDRRRIIGMYANNISGAEIAEEFGCDLRSVSLILNLAEMSADPQPVLVPSNVSGNHELIDPASTPSPIPFDTFVRKYWEQETRAVDMMLLPPEVGSKIANYVNEALLYAYEKLGRPKENPSK